MVRILTMILSSSTCTSAILPSILLGGAELMRRQPCVSPKAPIASRTSAKRRVSAMSIIEDAMVTVINFSQISDTIHQSPYGEYGSHVGIIPLSNATVNLASNACFLFHYAFLRFTTNKTKPPTTTITTPITTTNTHDGIPFSRFSASETGSGCSAVASGSEGAAWSAKTVTNKCRNSCKQSRCFVYSRWMAVEQAAS